MDADESLEGIRDTNIENIKCLKDRIEDEFLLDQPPDLDDFDYLRFLMARNFDIDAAFEFLVKDLVGCSLLCFLCACVVCVCVCVCVLSMCLDALKDFTNLCFPHV